MTDRPIPEIPDDLVTLTKWTKLLRLDAGKLRSMSLNDDFPEIYRLADGIYRVSDRAAAEWVHARRVSALERRARTLTRMACSAGAQQLDALRGRAGGRSA